MKCQYLSLGWICLLVMLFACKSEPEPEEILVFPTEDRSYAFLLDEFIDSVMTADRIPGLAVGVIKDNEIAWNKGYGQANIADGIDVSNNTRFVLTRPSEIIVSALVLDLLNKEGISFDTDINDILPEPIYNGRFPTAILTPRMLLSHVTGFKDNQAVLDSVYTVGDSPIRLKDFIYGYFGEEGEFSSLDNYDTGRPGRTYRYSRMNIALAAYLVEAITGLEFDLYSKINQFSDLGFTSVSWFLFDMQPEKLAVPYVKVGSQLVAQEQYGYPMYPSGLLRINIEYASRFFLSLIKRDQKILTRGAYNQMTTVQYDNVDPNQALGWRYTEIHGRNLLGLRGRDIGHSSRMFMFPGTETGVILMSNGAGYEEAMDTIMTQVFNVAEQL